MHNMFNENAEHAKSIGGGAKFSLGGRVAERFKLIAHASDMFRQKPSAIMEALHIKS